VEQCRCDELWIYEERKMKKILVIDDEEMIVDVMKLILEDLGHQVTGFHKSREGQKEAIENDYDLILVDLRMPERNGAEVTQSILEARPEARILIITAHPTDPLAEQALNAGAVALLKKPFEVGKILDFLKG
jgi:CheY-like chemotaxis protein